MNRIEDEHRNKNSNYMLFRVKHGVLKSQFRIAERGAVILNTKRLKKNADLCRD